FCPPKIFQFDRSHHDVIESPAAQHAVFQKHAGVQTGFVDFKNFFKKTAFAAVDSADAKISSHEIKPPQFRSIEAIAVQLQQLFQLVKILNFFDVRQGKIGVIIERDSRLFDAPAVFDMFQYVG